MEIEAFNGYIPNYPIIMSSGEHHGNVYAYNYQYPNDNLVWQSTETFVNQSDLSASSPTLPTPNSFYYQSSNLNSTSDENLIVSSSAEKNVKNKRGRKKGSRKSDTVVNKRSEKRSESPASPSVMKKRRLAANARERRRMNGLNTAFDKWVASAYGHDKFCVTFLKKILFQNYLKYWIY